jgi:RNA polymerase sigma-32 factor
MSQSLIFPTVVSEEGIRQYFRQVWKFPILDKEQEQMLAIQLRESGDTEAAHTLVTSHLRLVVKIAMRYKGYGLPISDLVSEGNIGLMRAVKKFDPDKGFRLSTYAMWWIKASITEFVLKSWSLVRMGTVAAQKKLFFSLRNLKARLNILDSGELSEKQAGELAHKLNATEEQVTYMNRRLSVRDLSLNAPMSGEDDGAQFQDALADNGPSHEKIIAEKEEKSKNSQIIAGAVDELPERERYIFMKRRLTENAPTLEELGVHFGVSRERVRQLEARAFKRVQDKVISQAKIFGTIPQF